MIKLSNGKFAGVLLLALLLQSCTATKHPAAPSPAATSPAAQEKPVPKASSVPESPDVIAKIGDSVITNGDVMARLMSEITPRPDYEGETKIYEPTNTRTILMKMIAEKAMLMEARRLNYQDNEEIRDIIKMSRNESLSKMLLKDYLQSKVKVSEEEIDKAIQADPNLNRNQAKQILEGKKNAELGEKGAELIEQFYTQLYKKHNFRKVSNNFPEAAQIYRRLLSEAAIVEGGRFVRIRQTRKLPPEEKNLVLMTYDNGKITLKDFIDTLCELSPLKRPVDLETPEGIDKFLSEKLRTPVFVAEACARGLDKNKDLLNQMKEIEDAYLLNRVISEKFKSVPPPTDQHEILAYYEKHKKEFGKPDMIRIDQIWCENLGDARKARTELSRGLDFESVKQEYSLDKTSGPVDAYPGTEGMFFGYLWKGEPNLIGGPVKGFYKEMLKWRVVKMLSKQPGQPKEYDSSMENDIKNRLWIEKKEAALEKYRQELLKKYLYQIYDDRIKDILTMP